VTIIYFALSMIAGAIGCITVGLKIFNVTDCRWIWVLSPLWGGYLVILILAIVIRCVSSPSLYE